MWHGRLFRQVCTRARGRAGYSCTSREITYQRGRWKIGGGELLHDRRRAEVGRTRGVARGVEAPCHHVGGGILSLHRLSQARVYRRVKPVVLTCVRISGPCARAQQAGIGKTCSCRCLNSSSAFTLGIYWSCRQKVYLHSSLFVFSTLI